jgi:ribonuclease HI
MTNATPLPTVTIYADGAAKGNGTPNSKGGWGYHTLFKDGTVTEKFGGEKPSTNNRMELTAVIQALQSLDAKHNVTMFTDSEYVIKGLTEWLPGWKRRGWKTSTGAAVKNIELWQQLDQLASRHAVAWNWVRGHNGDPGNERADALANMGVPA